MQLQYLDVLRQVGTSPSTKFVVPMELTGLLQGLVANATVGAASKDLRANNR
jgi:hypothetical protein